MDRLNAGVKKDLISIDDLSIEDLEGHLARAERVEQIPRRERAAMLPGSVLMCMFYEPSTRTKLSFDAAIARLGGSALGFSGTATTSVAKGESLADTIHTVERYADALVIRHPREGTARLAAGLSRLPVINAGDGANQHPTQTLLDLFTLKKLFGRVGGLKVALAGDLKYSRTVHSLFRALLKFDAVRFLLVSPESLRIPDYLKVDEKGGRLPVAETEDLSEAIRECDLVYMTRIQKERFPDPLDYERVKDSYCLDADMLKGAPSHLKVLHPLPRVNEIAPDVDGTVHAGYFDQVENGLIMRQAILLDALGAEV